jgi:hypothetical protein
MFYVEYEDRADLQDKCDTILHTSSPKLTALATELTTREQQVESLTAELHEVHETATSHSAKALRMMSCDAMQTDLVQCEAEEASWSMLCAELKC